MSIKRGGKNGHYKANYRHFDGVRLCANGRKKERRNGYKSKRANGGKIGGYEKMKKFIAKFIDVLAFVFSKRAGVDAGICDYSGQGRDKYGR